LIKADILGAWKILDDNHDYHRHMKRQTGHLSRTIRRSKAGRGLRYAAAVLLCIGLLTLITLGGLYLLVAGETGRGSVLVSKIEASLSELVGDEFDVEMENVNIGFSLDGAAKLIGKDVTIKRKSDKAILSRIGSIIVRSNISNLVAGNTSFDVLNLSNVDFNADILGPGNRFLLPPHLDKPLKTMGEVLSRFQRNMEDQGFRQFRVVDLNITGAVFGRLQNDPVVVQSLQIEPTGLGKLQLTAEIHTGFSDVNLISSYAREDTGESAYDFKMTGVSLREWLHDPDSDQGVIGSNGRVNLAGLIRFRKDHSAFDPSLNISSGRSILRVGKREQTEVSKLDLNLRLILARNQIELDPSDIEIGKLKATLIGGIKPSDDATGYIGPLLYDIVMQRGEFGPTLEGERVIPAGMKVAGLYDRSLRELKMNNVVLTTMNGAVQGTGVFSFTGETPSLKGEMVTEGISVLALKQYWPFFMAEGARKWIHEHIIDGHVTSGKIVADIPPGIIFRLRQGAKLSPEHFKAVMNLQDFAFTSFGEMPPIRDGEGVLTLEGMRISAEITQGKVTDTVKVPVEVESGSFVMEDFEAENRVGKASIRLSGDAKSIARISNREPLRVMQRLKVSASQFSGKAHADVAAEFPISPGVQYEDVKWNALLDLQNASSAKPIGGRTFAEANITIDANSESANVTGAAIIDGVKAELKLTEPIGKSGKAKRSRVASAILDNKAREKLGIKLDPVIDGPVKITLTQFDDRDAIDVDLTDATLALPWIGWSKGKKIAANAKFDLKQSGGKSTLSNFTLRGQGFSVDGNLVLDKSGLMQADLKNVSLNEDDSLSLQVVRDKTAFKINATGSSFDARGVMNTLIYESTFAKAQGERSVNLIANFSQVTGFKGRKLYDATLIYDSVNGRLNKVDLKARDQQVGTYSVTALRKSGETHFDIKSNNAGNALAFSNIYTRMESGNLLATLVQKDDGPYLGPVKINNFEVINEPRLASFASSVRSELQERGDRRRVVIPEDVDKRAKFIIAESTIEKGKGYLKINDSIIRNNALGLTATGVLYNDKDRMNLSGTFMPANVVNTVVSAIPLLGKLLSDGDNPFIGITYQLKGARENPQLIVNPLSIVAPGVFKKVFEFRN